ncbi:MAG: tetratricopeptide repeat protein [Thermodesulfovibrionales bacterium]
MEEDRLLDACDKTVMHDGFLTHHSSWITHYSLRITNTLLLFITVVLILSSCSLPRIIILRDPLSPEEHINLGLSYEEKGEYDAALREYETAAKQLAIAYFYIGNLYFKKGDFDKAEKAYKKSIKKTSDPRAMNNLAWLYYTLNKDLDRAEELAEEALKQNPDNQDFIDTLNKIKERRRNWQKE